MRKDVPWLAEVQKPPKRPARDAPQLSPLLADENGQSITTLEVWERKREGIRRWWLEFLGPLAVERQGPPPLEVLEEDRPDGVVRQLVRYEVEPGLPVEAYLLKPAKVDGPCPGVVALHSTVKHTIRQPAGVEGKPEKVGLAMKRLRELRVHPDGRQIVFAAGGRKTEVWVMENFLPELMTSK